MEEIKKECLEEINMQRENNNSALTDDEFLAHFQDYWKAFQLCDASFSYLRKLDPIEQELTETKQFVKLLQGYWIRLGLSITPKAFTLFHVICLQQEWFGGLGDKTEDWVERAHHKIRKKVMLELFV